MAESVEFEILIRHTTDLQVAVRANLTPLGAQLVSAQIITHGQYSKIRNAHRPVDERGADLVEYIQNKVLQNPQHYHTFIDVLRSDLSQYGDILAKLEQARLSQVSERQFVIPQPPPLRKDDNQLPAQGILFLLVLSRFCMYTGDISSLGPLSPHPFTKWRHGLEDSGGQLTYILVARTI